MPLIKSYNRDFTSFAHKQYMEMSGQRNFADISLCAVPQNMGVDCYRSLSDLNSFVSTSYHRATDCVKRYGVVYVHVPRTIGILVGGLTEEVSKTDFIRIAGNVIGAYAQHHFNTEELEFMDDESLVIRSCPFLRKDYDPRPLPPLKGTFVGLRERLEISSRSFGTLALVNARLGAGMTVLDVTGEAPGVPARVCAAGAQLLAYCENRSKWMIEREDFKKWVKNTGIEGVFRFGKDFWSFKYSSV